MKPEIKVGQERSVGGFRERIIILAKNEARGDWKVQHVGGRVSRLKTSSILRRYPLVMKDAPPEAKTEADDCSCAAVCDNPDSCPRVCTPPAAPSPLEVVRGNVLRWLEVGHEGLPSLRTRAEASLATLEESIRADAMNKAAQHMEDRATEIENGGGLTAEWMARVFRDEAKALRGK